MKPVWFKIRPPTEKFTGLKASLAKLNLVTVCQEASCPNQAECWSGGTATFMVLGDTCTRACKFCNVKTGNPRGWIPKDEPIRLASACKAMNLEYVVITVVDRDDLPDGGAEHIANCIEAVKRHNPGIIVEVLIGDFQGNVDALQTVIDAKPEVIAHNIETVERLQGSVRDIRAGYNQTIKVLETIKELSPKTYTKSSIMLGFGERDEEVMQTMHDVRNAGVDILTLGQYLRPSKRHLEVQEYVHPDKFLKFKEGGEKLGFKYVVSGPMVRSSYKAGELFMKKVLHRGVKNVN